jgi:hypothetical protein
MIDELAFGLAPMTVERLMDIVRRVNAEGATVILVEQSVNRAMTLAEHAFFLERGEVRFDGSITDLLSRDDLLRPVFLASVGAALGNGAPTPNGAQDTAPQAAPSAAPRGTPSAGTPYGGTPNGGTPNGAVQNGGAGEAPTADGLWLAGPGPSAGSAGPSGPEPGPSAGPEGDGKTKKDGDSA